jgi:putative membrane protein
MKLFQLLKRPATGLSTFFIFFVSASMAQSSGTLSDPEIASVAVVANQIDVKAGKMAQKKSSDPEVIAFAQTMVNDHQSVIDKASALVIKLRVTPKDNTLSRQLLSQAAKTEKLLSAKSGKAFDKAYVDNEVAYHKAVIGAVTGKLIPESQNAELKALLQSAGPIFQAHLEHAKMLQKKLSGK